jgi:hypothetical protein
MPFAYDPGDPGENAEELQVRKAAQRILMLHLRTGPAERPSGDFWPDVDLDFSGAALVGLNLTHCSIRSIVCFGAKFFELASFRGTEFRTKADFNKAQFAGPADFGTKSTARLAGAEARRGFPRTWPGDGEERPIADRPDWAELARKDEPGPPADR